MIVQYLGQLVRQLGQLEIMGGDESQAMLAGQRAHICPAADETLAVVCAAKDLVDTEQEWQSMIPLQFSQQCLEALDLSIEERDAIGYRVADAHAGKEPEGNGP